MKPVRESLAPRNAVLGRPAALADACAGDSYMVDYTTTTGARSRWTAVEEAHAYNFMQAATGASR